MSFDWNDVDEREIPAWFDEAKFGIFVHWGIFSVPAYAPRRCEVELTGDAYAEWYAYKIQKEGLFRDFHRKTYGDNFRYQDFAGLWRAELFDADRWANLFRQAGAKYVVLTTKHHDGFCLWPSRYAWNWNAQDIGPHRDIVGETMRALDRVGLRRGLYYSLWEWDYPGTREEDEVRDFHRYATEKMILQMKELIETYRPSVLFTDGDWVATSEEYHSLEFLEWLFEHSSVRRDIVVNDRWGSDTRNRHGGYLTSEYGEINVAGLKESSALERLRSRKWEECRSLGASFAFNRHEEISDYLDEDSLVNLLIRTVARGGNLLLNVGPAVDGTIPAIMQERLLQLGAWLSANGEGIYGTKPYEGKLPDDVYGTRKGENVYVFPPCGSGPIGLEWKNPVREIVRLDSGERLEFRQTEKQLETTIPAGDRFPGRICLKLCERDGK